jgi:hypothetical protein
MVQWDHKCGMLSWRKKGGEKGKERERERTR